MSKKLVLGLLLMLAMGLLFGNQVTVSGRLTAPCCDVGLAGHTILIEIGTHPLNDWRSVDTWGKPGNR